jgi:colicin import membrane protein
MESAKRHPFAGSDAGTRTWASMTAVSFACHLVFFGMMHYLPALRPDRKPSLPAVVNVTMVSLPEADTPKAAPAKRAETRPAPVTPPPKKPEVAPQPKAKAPTAPPSPTVKHSMKKKTYQSSKVVESAISRIEKKVAEEPPDPLRKALDRLRQQVGDAESGAKPRQVRPDAASEAGAGLTGADTEGIRKELALIDIYRMDIAWRVQKNWAFSESLAGSEKNLVVELAFTVLPNGEIRDIWFDKRSGNRYLDESAKRAVLKANPVGPHPEGITKPVITVGLRFTPEGVQ